MTQTDALGRSTFHHIDPQAGVRPTDREIRWLKQIERHGPQSSVYLHALTRDTHRCNDTSLRQMRKLRAGGFLALPRQQRATEHADFNPFIYDLTKKAKDHLTDLGIAEPTLRPTGHWWHGYMTSCVTSSIDILAARSGVRYIPGHKILEIRNAGFAIPVGKATLIPDQLFALDYGGSYRAFALEVDRGTEPVTSPAARKSYASAIELYRKLLEGGLHKRHYGLKANLLVLWVFASRGRAARFLEMVDRLGGSAKASVLVQAVAGFNHGMRPQGLLTDLYAEPWARAGLPPMAIS